MGGHFFVLRGDLKQLRCSAVLIPCDSDWKVVWDHWAPLLPEDRFDPPDPYGWRPLTGGGGTRRFTDLASVGDKPESTDGVGFEAGRDDEMPCRGERMRFV